MHSGNNTAIVIITYNAAELIRLQIEALRKYCKDNADIIIIDNSNMLEAIDSIKYHAEDLKCTYIKTNSASQNGSKSHAFAANLSYLKIKDAYEFIFYIDHDCFPIRPFSVSEVLGSDLLAGIGQVKSGKTYLWPGCFMFNNKEIGHHLIDFSTNDKYGLDTGGNLYKALEQHTQKVKHFNEEHCENPYYYKSFYNFYALINDKMFMHFVNASNWNNTNDHGERINSLINVLKSISEK